MKNLILTLSLFFSLSASALPLPPWEYPIPGEESILLRQGAPSLATAPQNIRVLVWNIHKTFDGEAWENDFAKLSAQSDLVFVQEGWMVPVYQQALQDVQGFLWSFVTAFLYKGEPTGVMIGSRWPYDEVRWERSPGHEPVIKTPKMAIIEVLPLASGQKLMTVTIHGLNFTPTASLRHQVLPLVEIIKKHVGPVIFGGDFNTWNPNRTNFLVNTLTAAGMSHVSFPGDPRRLVLDHIFFRGLQLQTAEVLSKITTSDHAPLGASFSEPLLRPVPVPISY